MQSVYCQNGAVPEHLHRNEIMRTVTKTCPPSDMNGVWNVYGPNNPHNCKVDLWTQPTVPAMNNVFTTTRVEYEGVSKSFRTDRLERELQIIRLSATRCSCIAILSQSSEFFRHNPLCCFSTSVYCCYLFRYRLRPETFGYILLDNKISPFRVIPYQLCDDDEIQDTQLTLNVDRQATLQGWRLGNYLSSYTVQYKWHTFDILYLRLKLPHKIRRHTKLSMLPTYNHEFTNAPIRDAAFFLRVSIHEENVAFRFFTDVGIKVSESDTKFHYTPKLFNGSISCYVNIYTDLHKACSK
jgi:hypothetical protein